MTYKLITEQELQQANQKLHAIPCECRFYHERPDCPSCSLIAMLRAVQEREGPKLRLTRHHQASMATIEELYSLPEEPK